MLYHFDNCFMSDNVQSSVAIAINRIFRRVAKLSIQIVYVTNPAYVDIRHIFICVCVYTVTAPSTTHLRYLRTRQKSPLHIVLPCNCSSCGCFFFVSFIWPMYLKYNVYVHIIFAFMHDLSAVWIHTYNPSHSDYL